MIENLSNVPIDFNNIGACSRFRNATYAALTFSQDTWIGPKFRK